MTTHMMSFKFIYVPALKQNTCYYAKELYLRD